VRPILLSGIAVGLVLACGVRAGPTPQSGEATAAWFSSAGDRLAYRAYGHGAPVIVVAGGPGLDADYMRPIAEDIAADGYRAVLPDLRGTGSSREAGKHLAMMTVSGSVADLEALREALGVERVNLVGHSFGGGMVQAYAQAHPDHVAGLVLVDSVGADLTPPPNPVFAARWMARLTPQERDDYAALRARGDLTTAMRLKFRATITDPARADAFLAALKPVADPVAQARLSADYRANYRVTQRDPSFRVTVLYGENDWVRDQQAQVAAAYPRAAIHIVPAAGHFSWIDRPKLFAAFLAAALRPGYP